jgi:hypothetical protein
MNDEEIVDVWTTFHPTMRQRRRIDARVSAWLEARNTSLAAEWIELFKIEPIFSVGLVTVSAVSIATAPPLIWLGQFLI